jgi:DNA-binding CsgD family transcriptional regulator
VYWGLSLGLVNIGEAFLFARISPSTTNMFLLVAVQLGAFIIGLALSRAIPSFFDMFGPVGVTVLFISGIVFSTVLVEFLPQGSFGPVASGVSVSLEVLSALCAGCGNALLAFFLFHHSRITTESDLCFNAIVGGLIACVLSVVVANTFDTIVVFIAVILGVGWLLCHREISIRTKHLKPAASVFKTSKRSVVYLYGALVVFAFICGWLPLFLFSDDTSSVFNMRDRLLITSLLIAAVLAFSKMILGRFPSKIIGMVRAFSVIVATGFLLLTYRHVLTATLGSMLVAYGLFVLAMAELYFCANYIGEPSEHPVRFWGSLIAVLLSTALTTTITIIISQQEAEVSTFFFPLALLCLYLVFIFLLLFQKIWTEPSPVTKQELEEALASFGSLSRETLDLLAKRHKLTRRESEIVSMLGKGWTISIIAKQLVVSQDTVRTHVKHLYQKLDVHSRSELISFLSAFDSEA